MGDRPAAPGSGDSEQALSAPRPEREGPGERDGHSPFPVVGIGASAGGLEAFKGLVGALPADTGMAFLLVQHLDPHHESQLAEILGRTTSMPVVEATPGLAVQPNQVYVIPPNTNMTLAQGLLQLTPRADSVAPHLPIDHLFRSLAEEQHGRAIGIVLSGSGSDGTLGLSEIKAMGGITFAQDEKSSGHSGMPRSALESGCVDFVLPVAEIAASLGEIGGHPYLNAASLARKLGEPESESSFRRILGSVRALKGVDFTHYRDTTIRRRILRRMALHREESLRDYAQRLESDRDEVEALYHDLLINVTSFFRDPKVFETLKEKVYPRMLEGRLPNAPIRIWVAGCSTGQEAYSIAMTLLEFFDDRPERPPIQIFATDLTDQTALDKARAGVYPEAIEAEVTPGRLQRFFRREDHVYRIDKALRDMCVFARHNMTSDPPFLHLDLISCRNVLIYLATPLQKRVLPTFHYALDSPGFLVLGSAESIGENADLFEVVDHGSRIYAKKSAVLHVPHHFPGEEFRAAPAVAGRREGLHPATPADLQREADRVLLGRYSPPGVLVNENLDVVQFRGRTSPYLESPPGEPTTNVLKLAREGLLVELRAALSEVRRGDKPVRRDHLRVRGSGPPVEFSLEVVPIRPYGAGNGCVLVLFHEVVPGGAAEPAEPVASEAPESAVEGDDAVRLRQELVATREFMQSLAEQQDLANEELRSANEEILASNEELQSTNEELETVKEELQSANEELRTVNDELQQRNTELNEINSDLINLQSSTTIPVVMVGGDMRIRRFTAPARKALGLVATDVGRSLLDVDLPIRIADLEQLIGEVIDSMQPREREVRDPKGRWYALRVHPYRTIDNRIDGAVLVFVDVDRGKRAEALLREMDQRKDEFIATLGHELRNPIAPIRNAVEILRLSAEDPAAASLAREVLDRQVGQLSRIIDDLLDVSRIVEGKIELRRRRVSLRSVVEMAVETSQPFIQARHHHLTVSLPSQPLFLDADASRISQVLVNLLNNAAKYMDQGGRIWLTAERVPMRRRSDAAADEVRIAVRDTGIGIDPELMPRIFDIFSQGERVYEHSRVGLGVGLALVRSLVQMHKGRVSVASDGPGLGSEFTVHLPLAILGGPVDPVAVDGPASDGKGVTPPRRILVVDDNFDQAQSLAMLLKLMGHEVFVAHEGPAAIEEALRHHPDLALIDIGLPGMSGYDVARRLREYPELAGTVLVAQTGWGQEEDRRRSAQAGFDHHVVKPLDLEGLQGVLARSRTAEPGPVPGGGGLRETR
jgi:two-component system CheB/CheR fusion protein